MDKTKDSPLPEKTGQPKQDARKDVESKDMRDPQFIRGTIDPPTKKER